MSKERSGVLYVGMDLGTMRTSVAASNGVRESDWSFVGYPKDLVSRKLLKTDRVFGREALSKRLALDLFRPFAEGMIKYTNGNGNGNGDVPQAKLDDHMRAAKDLVQYGLRMAKPRKDELVYGVLGVPAQASIENKRQLIEAARGTLDAVMVCSEPFAVAYGLELLEDTLVIDIGAGTIDLCRMHGTMPGAEDQVTITTAGDWLDQQLMDKLKYKIPEASFTIHQVKLIKERYAFVGDISEPCLVDLIVKGRPTTFDVTKEVRDACRMMIGPIVDALQELIASFDPDFQHKLRENVLLAGGGSQIRDLDRVLEEYMKRSLSSGSVKRAEEPVYAGCNGALKLAHDMPEEFWKQLSE